MRREVWDPPPAQSEAKVVISLWGDDYGGWISAAKLISSASASLLPPLFLLRFRLGISASMLELVRLAGRGSNFPAPKRAPEHLFLSFFFF